MDSGAQPSPFADHAGTKARGPGHRPARVLQVLPAMDVGGVERGTIDIVQSLTAAGFEPWIASSGGMLVNDLRRAGGRHVRMPLQRKNLLSMVCNIGRLARLIEAEGIDIVHARSRAPAWSALFAARRTGRRFVTTYHGTYNARGGLKVRYNSVMARGDAVIAISEFIGRHVRDTHGTSEDRLRVVPRGVDLSYFDPGKVHPDRMVALARKWRLPDDRRVIMLPARLSRWKGHEVLLSALGDLARDDLCCLFVGSDRGHRRYADSLLKSVQRMHLDGVVRMVGHCSDMAAAYMLSDAVVSPATDPEAFGRVALEAQAMGRPTVASDHGATGETIIDGETGWLVPPGDPSVLARVLRIVLALGPSERGALAGRARAHVGEHFSKQRMCARTLDIYRELLVAEDPRPR